MNNDLDKFKKLYIETAKEQLQTLKLNLTNLTSSDSTTAVNNVFIAAHSLKGQSMMMGYEQVGKISQIIEKSFRAVKEGLLPLDQLNLTVIEDVVIKLNSWLEEGENSTTEPNFDNESEILGGVIKNI